MEVYKITYSKDQLKGDIANIDCKIKNKQDTIHSISAISFNGTEIDYEYKWMTLINQYPLFCKIKLYIEDGCHMELLFKQENITYKEICKNNTYTWYSIEVRNSKEFTDVYEYLHLAASYNLTSIYSIQNDILIDEDKQVLNLLTNEIECSKEFIANFQINNTVAGIGPDGSGIEIWTTNKHLIDENFYLKELEKEYEIKEY